MNDSAAVMGFEGELVTSMTAYRMVCTFEDPIENVVFLRQQESLYSGLHHAQQH